MLRDAEFMLHNRLVPEIFAPEIEKFLINLFLNPDPENYAAESCS